MAMSLTHRQAELLRFIERYQRANGYSPSYQEAADAIGGVKSNIACLVGQLEDRGYVRRLANRNRAIEILRSAGDAPAAIVIGAARYRYIPIGAGQ